MVSPRWLSRSKKIEVDFPGFGKFKPRIFGHPEAITFPHHFKTIKNSINLSHGSWFWYAQVDYETCRLENYFSRKGCRHSSKSFFFHKKRILMTSGIETGLDLKNNNPKEPPPLYSLAIGKKDGKQASCGTIFRSSGLISMGEATGIPLACGLKLLVDGKDIKKRCVCS